MQGAVMKKYIRILLTTLTICCFSMAAVAALHPETAKEIAAKAVPDSAEFVEIENDSDEYEVKFIDSNRKIKYSVDVSKEKEAVTKFEMKRIYDYGSNNIILSQQEVVSIVKKEYPDAAITKVKLDSDDGLKEYKVKFTTPDVEGEMEINPQTGVVIGKTIKYVK